MSKDKLIKNDFMWNIGIISIGITFSFLLGVTLKFIKGIV